MEAVEYIQFHPVLIALAFDFIDPDECQSDDILCSHKGGQHYHLYVTPFSIGGFGVAHYDASISELVPLLRADFMDTITAMIEDDKYFTLAFKVMGIADHETGHIDTWDYELLGKVEQEGNNLVVNPIVG